MNVAPPSPKTTSSLHLSRPSPISRRWSGCRPTLVPARNLYHLFETTALLHPDRQALTVLGKSPLGSGETSLTHRELLAEITKAANLFRSYGITPGGPTIAVLCPILPEIFPALLGAQVAGVAGSINYLLNENAISDLLEAQDASVLIIPSELADFAIWTKANNVAARTGSLTKILVVGEGRNPTVDSRASARRSPISENLLISSHWTTASRCVRSSTPEERPVVRNSFA